MIHVHQAGTVKRAQLAELFAGVLTVIHPGDIRPGSGGHRDARAVRQHVADGDAILAAAGEGGQVLAHTVVERERSAFDEQMHHRRRDGLGGRVHAKRRVGGDGDLLGVGRIGGPVTPTMPDGTVEDHFSLVPQTHLDRRVHTRLIPVPGRLPNALNGGGIDLGVVLGLIAAADVRHRVQVGRNPYASVVSHDALSPSGNLTRKFRPNASPDSHSTVAARAGSDQKPRSRPMSSFMISLEPAQILVTRASIQARATRYSFM